MKLDPDIFASLSAVLFNDYPVPAWVHDRETVRFHTMNAAAVAAALEEAQEMAQLGSVIFDLADDTYHLGGILARAYGCTEIAFEDVEHEIARVWHPDDMREGARLAASLHAVEPYDGEFRLNVEGEYRWFHGRTSVVHSAHREPTGIVGIAVDITDRKREAEHLRLLAFTDTSTGLPNRTAMLEQAAIADADAAGLVLVRITWVASTPHRTQQLRVHTAQAIAATLKKLAPEDALLFRYSDEKFAIVTRRTERLRVPLPLAKRILTAFEEPLTVGEDEFIVVPTIGVSGADGPGCGVVELARRAEIALHEAARSDDRIAVYTTALAGAQDRRVAIERNLRHAIVQDRVAVVYQPIVSLHSGRVVGAEALMRWDCPGIGPVPPPEFIAIAEESGVISRLGEWILRSACEQTRSWQLAGAADLRIAVNVSAKQVQQREFFRLVMQACESSGLAPADLELELTETVMMRSDGLTMRNLEALRRAGVRISIDDFGTGYSALGYLTKLPLDAIKLDRAFIEPIVDDPFQADVAASVIVLAHRRGLSVVGEGVETSAQLARLTAMGCDEAQGYLFARPLQADDFAAYIHREQMNATLPRRLVRIA